MQPKRGRVVEVTKQAGVTPAQVCLSWAVQRGIPIVPKSVQRAHLEQNLHLTRLPDDLFKIVDTVSSEKGPIRFLDPSRHTCFDIFDEENDQPVENKAPWG